MNGRRANALSSSGLTIRQERSIPPLLSSTTTRAAAKAAGVSEATIYRWLADPTFNKALEAARARAFDLSLLRLSGMADRAVDVVGEVLDDKRASAGARISAARVVLSGRGSAR